MSPRQAAAARRLHAPEMVGGRDETAHPVCGCCTRESRRLAPPGEAGREVSYPCRYWREAAAVPAEPERSLASTLVTVGLASTLSVSALWVAFATPLGSWLSCLVFPALVGGLLVLARRMGAL